MRQPAGKFHCTDRRLASAIIGKRLTNLLDSVDRKTDDLMQRIIRQEFAHHTVIVIAHRLETILDFDRIVVLDKGELKECDSPSNLLASPSAFKELYEMYEMKKEEHTSDDGSQTSREI